MRLAEVAGFRHEADQRVDQQLMVTPMLYIADDPEFAAGESGGGQAFVLAFIGRYLRDVDEMALFLELVWNAGERESVTHEARSVSDRAGVSFAAGDNVVPRDRRIDRDTDRNDRWGPVRVAGDVQVIEREVVDDVEVVEFGPFDHRVVEWFLR